MPVQSHEIARGIIILVVLVLAIGFLVVISIKKSEEPSRMLVRWLLTGVAGGVMVLVGNLLTNRPILGLLLTGLCALVMAALWRHAIAALIAKPLGDLYDGGNAPPDPHPAYSVALSRQKRGRYLEAVAEIRKQLERFPTDFEGQLLLAQIQAEDLKDPAAAEMTIQRLCAQPGHAPANLAFALFSLTDWHLTIGQDREAARRQLNKLLELLPDSEFAMGAAHRLAHLDNPEMPLADEEQKKFIVTEGVKYPGLAKSRSAARPEEKSPGEQAAEYVSHLEKHPLDSEAREKLAILYARHFGRLDLATGELDQLIQTSSQPGRLVARWLNLLADLQIHCGADYETVCQTLQQIVDCEPKSAAAGAARKRIGLLKLELKAREGSRGVELGSYEQNIGLKYGRGPGTPPA
jgi:tetratricopeptide (TPR) repeat protein